MVEHPRLSLPMLIIAAATLATDVTRLLWEMSAPSANHERVPTQPSPDQQAPPRQAPDVPVADTAQKPDSAQKKAERSGVPGAHGPPRGPHEFGTPRERLSQLPLDFSINHPPWCPACRQPMRRYIDRRRLYEW